MGIHRLSFALFIALCCSIAEGRKPNIIYIMCDELGYYELSCMGNPNFVTPNIDKLAAGGVRYTQALSGAPVCAPLRAVLMTGKHMGHCSVRKNDGGTPLRAEEETVASVLKRAGYATGGFGKWGAGGRGSTGVPEKHGFDLFVGYYDQVHAHSYYPPYIIRNSEEMPLKGNKGGSTGETYSHYVIFDEAKMFIRENKDKPFFCYMPFTPPHGIFDIPDSDPSWQMYKDKDWPEQAKRYAAMVNMVDRQVGETVALVNELGLEKDTLIVFCGDNGGNDYFRTKDKPRGFHSANVHPKTGVEFRGHKGNLYEGGLRIPMMAYWPGKIKAGRVSDFLWYFPDVLPTLAELAGEKAPRDVDGISILPELLGEDAVGRKQEKHKYLYWEYGSHTAVRMNNWKAVRPKTNVAWELYDLTKDISETTSVAEANPEIMKQMIAYAEEAHEPVQQGTFADRTLHERDRQAKFGNTRRGGSRVKAQGKVHKLTRKGMVSNTKWKLVSVSSESKSNGKFARNVFDDDPLTHWHSEFSKKHPHELVIDLGAQYTVSGFYCLARQDAGWNGTIGKCEFFVGDDPKNFGKAVATATMEKIKKPQKVDCDKEARGRYVKLRVLSEVNAKQWASLSELGVIGQ